jgi:hypothetical protein
MAEVFIDRAFTQINVLSALRTCGISPRDNTKILGKCPAFKKLNDEEAAFVIASIVPGSEIVDRRGWVPEEFHDEMFAGESYDNMPTTGMPLNDRVTNHQRCMIDSHDSWIKILEQREIAAAAAAEEKRRKEEEKRLREENPATVVNMRSCCNCACPNKTSMKKTNKIWKKRPEKGCRLWACHEIYCQQQLLAHTNLCTKRVVPNGQPSRDLEPLGLGTVNEEEEEDEPDETDENIWRVHTNVPVVGRSTTAQPSRERVPLHRDSENRPVAVDVNSPVDSEWTSDQPFWPTTDEEPPLHYVARTQSRGQRH